MQDLNQNNHAIFPESLIGPNFEYKNSDFNNLDDQVRNKKEDSNLIINSLKSLDNQGGNKNEDSSIITNGSNNNENIVHSNESLHPKNLSSPDKSKSSSSQ